MRMVRDDRNQLRFDGRINLNLGVAMVSVPIDVLNCLLGGVHPHFRGTRKLPVTIDDSGFQHARPELAAVIEARNALKKRISVIRQVTRAGHAISEVERAIVVAEMLVSHKPGIRKRPCASIISAFAGALTSASGPTRTMRSPLTTTLVAGVTRRSRGSNNRAFRMTKSPRRTCASARAIRSDHAASVFCCASRNCGIEDSAPSGTTENQGDTDADVPLRSNQIGCGENPRPVMRYSVSSVLPTVTGATRSIVASPAGRSGSL